MDGGSGVEFVCVSAFMRCSFIASAFGISDAKWMASFSTGEVDRRLCVLHATTASSTTAFIGTQIAGYLFCVCVLILYFFRYGMSVFFDLFLFIVAQQMATAV